MHGPLTHSTVRHHRTDPLDRAFCTNSYNLGLLSQLKYYIVFIFMFYRYVECLQQGSIEHKLWSVAVR